jgi:hypothetical protein
MRNSFLLYLLLVGTVLTWSACDDEDLLDCGLILPEINYSLDCTPGLAYFRDFLGFPSSSDVNVSPGCVNANDHGQTFQLIKPANANDNVNLHIYNATYGFAYVQVFGSNDCGLTTEPLSDCFSTSAVAKQLTVNGLSSYAQIFVRVDIAATGPSDPYEEYIPEEGQYIAIAAYGSEFSPKSVPYQGYDLENGIDRLTFSCDGSTTNRVILGSCNPNADVDEWQEEVGLTKSESYSGPGGTITASEVPDGFDPNVTGDALATRRPRQNTDDFFVEQDFIITVPVPNAGEGLDDAIDNSNVQALLECLTFNLGTRSSEKPDDQVIVTMIDSGVDPERAALWDNHLNRSIDNGPLVRAGFLGHDFIRGSSQPNDEFGHGTNTTGALIGNYKGEKPLTVIHNKIFGDSPEGVFSTYFGSVVATHTAGEIGSTFINMSFGASPEKEPQALRCAIEFAISRGATIIASAGNETADIDTSPQWPASFSSDFPGQVITVTSYNYPGDTPDDDPILSDFSNAGADNTNVAAYLTAKTPVYGSPALLFNYLAGTSISAPVFTSALATSLSEGQLPIPFLNDLPESPELIFKVKNSKYLPVCDQ